MGGGTGTAIVTLLCVAFPSACRSGRFHSASRDIREYIGTKDIVMFHSVADLLGFNEFIRLILDQASHAVCGMVERGSLLNKEKPMVAVTAYGINSTAPFWQSPPSEQRGTK